MGWLRGSRLPDVLKDGTVLVSRAEATSSGREVVLLRPDTEAWESAGRSALHQTWTRDEPAFPSGWQGEGPGLA